MTDQLEIDATQNGWEYPRWAEIEPDDAVEETPDAMTDHTEEQRELEGLSSMLCGDRGHYDGKSLFI